MHSNRRTFLKAVGLGAAGAAVGAPVLSRSSVMAQSPAAVAGAVRLGVASYSLRRFSREEAIAMTKALRTPYINIKSFHLEYELTPAELAAGRREFQAAGLQIVGGGTITFREDTDADVRTYFEYAKHSGMPLMVATCDPAILPRVERFAKQYGIKVAIHNHGPEDRFYPAPQDVIRHIKDMDPLMGVCADLGHTTRAGVDVVQTLAEAGSRLLDIHMKDLRDLSDKDSQCIVGQGAMPVADIFAQLQRMNYQGFVNLEYEIDVRDPLPGMQQSFAYMRGVLSGLERAARA